MNLRKLKQKLRDLQAEGRGLSEEAKALEAKIADAGEAATDQDRDALSALNAKIDDKMAEVKAAEAAYDQEAARIERESVFRDAGDTVPAAAIDHEATDRNGFAHIAEFARCVHAAATSGGPVDERLLIGAAPSNFHQEQGTAEGYMVPPAFRSEIWELVHNGEDLLNQIDMEPTNASSVQHLADETTPWGSAGVQAHWRSEGTQMTADKLDTNARNLPVHQLYAFVLATDELLADSPRMASRLTNKSAQAIRWKASESIFTGTGVGQPLGMLNSDALVSVAKESGQSADTIVVENVAKMFSRMLGDSIGRSFWQVNSDTLPQLITMTLGGNPIWTPPASGVTGAPGGFLLGRPIRFSEHAKTVGDQGDIALIDGQGYYGVRRTAGIDFAQSMHLFFDYGVQAFRWTFRFGGQPHLSAPVSPANGSNTKSHFVVLDERA